MAMGLFGTAVYMTTRTSVVITILILLSKTHASTQSSLRSADGVHYTMEYHSAIKKKEIMPFTATWMDLEIIILSEISQRQISYDIIHMWNLKNELIYKIQTDSWKTNLWLPKEKGKRRG